MEPSSLGAGTTLCWCFSQDGASKLRLLQSWAAKDMYFPGQTKGLSKSNTHLLNIISHGYHALSQHKTVSGWDFSPAKLM